MLIPHGRENAHFRKAWIPAYDLQNTIVLVWAQPMGGNKVGRYLIRKLTGRGKVGIAIKCRFCAKAWLNWQIGSATAMWARQKKAGHMARRKSNREVMRRALGRRTHEAYLGAPSHPCKSCKRKAAMRSGHSYFCISRPRSARRRAMISSWTKSRKAAMRREWRNSSG